jgi:hypothetical protein
VNEIIQAVTDIEKPIIACVNGVADYPLVHSGSRGCRCG